MPLKTAYRLNPQAVFLPVDYEAYLAESRKVKRILRDISPLMEDVGIDEAFLDIIRDIKKKISAETGLTCSIGIGPNKLLAKIASDMEKPDGYTLIGQEDVEINLWPLPVRKLWGVGPKTETILKDMGIERIGELAALKLDTLIATFGKSYGSFLYEASHGIDEAPLITLWEPRSMSRETTFQKDVGHWQTVAKTLADLTREVVSGLREEGFRAKTVTVKIRFRDFQTLTRSVSLALGSDSEGEIRKAAFACLKRIELKQRVRLIGIRLTHLDKGSLKPG